MKSFGAQIPCSKSIFGSSDPRVYSLASPTNFAWSQVHHGRRRRICHPYPSDLASHEAAVKGSKKRVQQSSSKAQIAVKRLKVWSNKVEMEFAVEVEILGRARHKNLMSLCGYCAEGKVRLTVYDYMPNFSLLSHLHGQHSTECQLDWSRQMKITIGSAEGIVDIKANNVLLDSDFEAKVVDFGFAKLVPDGATHVTTKVKGTLGYRAPEYARHKVVMCIAFG